MIDFRPAVSSVLSDDVLSRHANIDAMPDQFGRTYRYVRRSVRPAGLFQHPDVLLKVYHLIRENTPLEPGSEEGLEAFLAKEAGSGQIDLKQGIGFAILGQGFVTIHVWGKGNGLFNYAYSVEDSYPELSRLPLERAAVACTWDGRILNYEQRLWHHYLLTERSAADKRRYLDQFIAGDLEDEAVCVAPNPYAAKA